jgi:hypothetical protein
MKNSPAKDQGQANDDCEHISSLEEGVDNIWGPNGPERDKARSEESIAHFSGVSQR